MDVINLFIKQKGLDITKLRHFGSDGAATMTGFIIYNLNILINK